MDTEQLRTAQSRLIDARAAARDIHAQLVPKIGSTVLFFCSSQYNLEVLGDEINRLFAGNEVIGCTTAGEIGPAGYLDNSLSAVCFPQNLFTAVTGRLDNLASFRASQGRDLACDLKLRLRARTPETRLNDTFGFLLIDGLSKREETVITTLHEALGDIALAGGSAGDDQHFKHTHVFHEGSFHNDSAVLLLAATSLPFRAFITHHYQPGNERLLVTEADVRTRTVIKLNGQPAAQEYARLLGIEPEKLSPAYFAASPVVTILRGTPYVRSIQKQNPDGSLTFYCAIEEGQSLQVTGALDLVENMRATFQNLHSQLGEPILTLACDCVLRKLIATQKGIRRFVEDILKDNSSVGFTTYGEQFKGIHANQTFTGIAFGKPPHPPETRTGP
ncbi:Uncharacterized conserved protein, contains FIST_N domain [Formivibrio citricus]|uniref:Uncharacterized conserved protein, contains FIST_N domain n=1 Tax=Formivibrio citricus TaxID=83765 RepID=A0A1I4WJC3_9NEIS|nr:FIST N-terminal domain-containing protein [Formivibrio citricus]SFN13798.1 Uncharacterized conserved protein, contains FIST_N domain [Formivibrio citricus]